MTTVAPAAMKQYSPREFPQTMVALAPMDAPRLTTVSRNSSLRAISASRASAAAAVPARAFAPRFAGRGGRVVVKTPRARPAPPGGHGHGPGDFPGEVCVQR